MRNIQIDTEVLRKIVQESVQEALKAERFNLYNSFIPMVSDNEMNEIIARLGEKPQPQSTVDYTEWFDNEN